MGILGGNDVGVDCNVRAREEATKRAQLIVLSGRGCGGCRATSLAKLRRGEGDDTAVPARGGTGGGGAGASEEGAAGEEES